MNLKKRFAVIVASVFVGINGAALSLSVPAQAEI